jgi:pilus assembly protein CpaB
MGMARRTLLLITSIFVAAAGTALVWVYVANADARAQAGWGRTVAVLVASDTIDPGAAGDSLKDKYVSTQVPVRLAPPSRITSLSAVAGKLVTSRVLKGQFLVNEQFGDVVPQVTPGHYGIAVAMEDPNRAAGLLRAGSQVAVLYIGGSEADPKGTDQATLLIPSTRVIGLGGTTVGTRPGAKSGAPQVSSSVVTLDVSVKDAAKLALATETGTLYFILLGDPNAALSDVTVTAKDLTANG